MAAEHACSTLYAHAQTLRALGKLLGIARIRTYVRTYVKSVAQSAVRTREYDVCMNA